MVRVLSLLLYGSLVAFCLVLTAGFLLDRPVLVSAVQSNSMKPTLHEGDVFLLLPRPGASPLQEGQIVVFRPAGSVPWVVHRVVGGNETDGYITRGDANALPDLQPVFPEDVAGVVPTWGGRPLRIGRLGRLSTTAGVLPRPAVTAILLAVSVVLMTRSHRRGGRRSRYPFLEAYAVLTVSVTLVGFIPAYAFSRREPVQYEVVAQNGVPGLAKGMVLAGEPREETVEFRNPLPIPVVVMARSNDSALWAGAPVLVRARGVGHLRFRLTASTPGSHDTTLERVVTLPLLPPAVLGAALRLGAWAPVAATAAVPALLLVAVAAGDPRLRSDLRRWQARFH